MQKWLLLKDSVVNIQNFLGLELKYHSIIQSDGKTFNEYYGGGIRVGGADSIVPTASLGDGPPKGQGGRDMRGVGLRISRYKVSYISDR